MYVRIFILRICARRRRCLFFIYILMNSQKGVIHDVHRNTQQNKRIINYNNKTIKEQNKIKELFS